ncbi:MAG: hypothetical protein Q7R40_14215 [Phaeospirillum sp.]|nr:hypothetical protein [Phaeospirillum sp.]
MAVTATFTGAVSLSINAQAAYTVDASAGPALRILQSLTWAFTGGDAPTIAGWLYSAEVTCAAGDWLLAHATDPFQGMGDSVYPTGFIVAGSKLKLLYIRNTDPTNTITIVQGAVNGLPIFVAAGDGITLASGDWNCLYKKAGTAALTTGSNDKLTISVGAGSPTCEVAAFYGA